MKHFADAMRAGFLGNVMAPSPTGPTQASRSNGWTLAVVAVWGIAGLVLAARFFSWEPRR